MEQPLLLATMEQAMGVHLMVVVALENALALAAEARVVAEGGSLEARAIAGGVRVVVADSRSMVPRQ